MPGLQASAGVDGQAAQAASKALTFSSLELALQLSHLGLEHRALALHLDLQLRLQVTCASLPLLHLLG